VNPQRIAFEELCLSVADEAAMAELGERLAQARVPGLIVYLNGDLGMGKTTLARGFIHSLGHAGAVKSPTYTLVEPYELSGLAVYHFDLYRLGNPEELEYMGVRDYFDGVSVCLVEWSERGMGVLPPADLVISIESEGLGRSVSLLPLNVSGESVVGAIDRE